MCEKLRDLLASLMGDQSNQLKVSETPSHLCEPADSLARVNAKIQEYIDSFGEDGSAPIRESFGTLTREEIQTIIDRFATDEGHIPNGTDAVVYRTCLVDKEGDPLYLRVIGDYGVQIDWRSFD